MGEEGWSPERKGLIQSGWTCLETGKSSLNVVQFGLDPGPWVCSIPFSLSLSFILALKDIIGTVGNI